MTNKISIRLFLSGFVTLLTCSVLAETPCRQLLWPSEASAIKSDDPKQYQPAITVYSSGNDTVPSTAVIIFPGGGYDHLAMKHEGVEIAEWLNSIGVTGIILEYRNKKGGFSHPAPLMDAQRAIRTVRFRAKELNVNPARIGIMGFSAGGHLASTAGTHFDQGIPNAPDPIDQVSSRPDFMILCYPVIAFGEPYTHRGSQKNLIGDTPDKELVISLSNEKQVTADTPPTFLYHTDSDKGVLADNSIAFYMALRKANVPAELHIYRDGSHGLGLAKQIPGTRDWPRSCEQWLRGQGFLSSPLHDNTR